MKLSYSLLLCFVAATSVQAAWGFGGSKQAEEAPAPAPAEPPHVDAPFAGIPVEKADPASAVQGGAVSPPSSFSDDSTAPTGTPRAPYEGTQYSFGPFKAIRPAELQYEIGAIAALLSYIAISFIGSSLNKSRAKAWYDANNNAFVSEFAAWGMVGGVTFKSDGGDEYLAYATGRRGVEKVNVRVKTAPWNDPFVVVYNFLRPLLDVGWRAEQETVTIDMKLKAPQGTPNAKLVFAVATRQSLRAIREDRWDLKTFTQTSEFSGLPASFIAMTESGDLSSALLRAPETGLMDALNAPESAWIKSLVISDMPKETPDEYKPVLPTDDYNLTLTLTLPPASKSAETVPLVHLICNIADVLFAKQRLVPDIALQKRKVRRAEVLTQLNKVANEEAAAEAQEKKENALALKKKMEKDALEAKMSKMSKEERIKFAAKEKEKERKRLVKSMSRKK